MGLGQFLTMGEARTPRNTAPNAACIEDRLDCRLSMRGLNFPVLAALANISHIWSEKLTFLGAMGTPSFNPSVPYYRKYFTMVRGCP